MFGIAAVTFKQDEKQAHAAFKKVCDMAHSRRIHLETATMGMRLEDGTFKMEEAQNWVETADSNWNRFWRRALHRQDAHGHDEEFIVELGDKIAPGDAAVFVSYELRFRPETVSELHRLGGEVIVNELTPEQKAEMLAEIQADEQSAMNKAYKKREKGELIDSASESGVQNIE